MSVPFLGYQTDTYKVSFSISQTTTHITMNVPTHLLTTQRIPTVHTTLSTFLPSIFDSTCYNEYNLPFSEEVKMTETAHLFEHIFLEYLSHYDTRSENKKVYKGVTSWDWRKDPMGLFDIRLNVGTKDMLYISHALKKTIELFSKIMDSSERSIH